MNREITICDRCRQSSDHLVDWWWGTMTITLNKCEICPTCRAYFDVQIGMELGQEIEMQEKPNRDDQFALGRITDGLCHSIVMKQAVLHDRINLYETSFSIHLIEPISWNQLQEILKHEDVAEIMGEIKEVNFKGYMPVFIEPDNQNVVHVEWTSDVPIGGIVIFAKYKGIKIPVAVEWFESPVTGGIARDYTPEIIEIA